MYQQPPDGRSSQSLKAIILSLLTRGWIPASGPTHQPH